MYVHVCTVNMYRIEQNFCPFRPGAPWVKIPLANILLSENFVLLKFFTRAVFLTILCIDLHPSLMSPLSYFICNTSGFADSAGPLLSELSLSAIAEANAAVNGMQQAKTKKREPYVENRSASALHVHSMAPPTTFW